jgi:hypothetical protein
MLGGVSAIVWGLFLAGMAWQSMWPWGSFVMWVAPQQLLTQWAVGCLVVGGVLLVGGARAAGAALVGSAVGSIVAYLSRGLYGGDHLESLVHGAVIMASLGLIVFGLRGLRRRARAPLGRYPVALALAIGTVVVGSQLILRIHEEAAPTCSLFNGPNVRVTNTSSPFAASCFRGFEEPWLQALLWFNVAFLALLFLVQAWRATRSSGEQEEEDDTMSAALGRLLSPLARDGGNPFFLQLRSPGADERSSARHRRARRLWAVLGATSILIVACTSTATRPNPSTGVCFDAAKVRGLYEEWAHAAAEIWVGDGVDLAQVAASLRAARETLLELALATAADPVAAGHFQDAADSYLKVPPIPPDASLDAMSRSEIDRLERTFTGTGGGVYDGIEALNNSDIPFC